MKKWYTKIILTICLLVSIGIYSNSAMANEKLPSSIYLAQEEATTCTLASSAMMLRARFYLSGNDNWSAITEQKIKDGAWLSGVGLKNDRKYSLEGNNTEVKHESLRCIIH